MHSKPIRYVAPEQVLATRPEGSTHLRVEFLDDQVILQARIKRTFPLSKPREFLSIQTADNKEVAVLKTMDGLEPSTKKLFDEELDRRYFTPQIEKINQLKQDAGMWKFSVNTQRGPAEFYVRNWRDNAHEIAVGRWQINSVDGARFEIKDLEALDVKSRAFMDMLL